MNPSLPRINIDDPVFSVIRILFFVVTPILFDYKAKQKNKYALIF